MQFEMMTKGEMDIALMDGGAISHLREAMTKDDP